MGCADGQVDRVGNAKRRTFQDRSSEGASGETGLASKAHLLASWRCRRARSQCV